MFRTAAPSDSPDLVGLATETGIFQPGEAEVLLGGVLQDFHAGRLGDGHQITVLADDATGTIQGWVYFAPTPKSDGVWDLWWIGVRPTFHGQGLGSALLGFVEKSVKAAGGRLLIIETSSLPPLEPTRRFYARRGYTECGCIPDFYADGDGKIIFAKRVAIETND